MRTPKEVIESNADILNYLTIRLEREIANYELLTYEDLYDEENEDATRHMVWNHGTKSYSIVITPEGMIRYAEPESPQDLIIQITNKINHAFHETWEKILEETK